MRRLFALAVGVFVGLAAPMAHAEQIGEVSTVWNMMGPNDKIVIEAFGDPEVRGVTCHLSRAKKGGVGGAIGWAEDPSDASIACRQTGPISVDMTALRKKTGSEGEFVFKQSTSILFKKLQVKRFVDVTNNTLIYLTYSDKVIDGSPKNAISTVPVMPWGTR